MSENTPQPIKYDGFNLMELGSSPRVWLAVPCLIPVVMGNNGGIGLTSIGLGGLLMSRGVEDLYFCKNSKDPYYKLLFSYGIITIATGSINYGLSITSQENPETQIVRKIRDVWRCAFSSLGIVAGVFFIFDGVLSVKPNLISNNAFSNIITKRNFLDHETIINDEALKNLSNICLHIFQQFKILGGSALILASVQDISRKIGFRYLSSCYDDTVYYVKHALGYIFPDDSYFGAVVCLFGAGTSIDGWRRLLHTNHGIYDVIKNAEIAAGGVAIYYGSEIIAKSINKEFHGSKDLPLASTYFSVATTLFKYTLIDIMSNNPSLLKPMAVKSLVSSLFTMSLGYNGAQNLLKASMRPFGHKGDEITRKFTKYSANAVWVGMSGLCSFVCAQHTYDYYTAQPITPENVVKSTLTCAASQLCYYSAIDFLLGNRPSPDSFIKKISGALVSSVAITGLVYLVLRK